MPEPSSRNGRVHVAFIITDLGGGGAERVVLNLAGGLLDRGHKVDIVLLRERVNYKVPEGVRLFTIEGRPGKNAVEGAAGVSGRRIRLPGRFTPLDWARMACAVGWNPFCLPEPRHVRQARALACYMGRYKPDCVLSNIPAADIATLWATRFVAEPPPIIPVLHNFVGRENWRHLRRFRYLLARAARFVGVSRGVSASLSANMGVPGDGITTIYNPAVTPDLQVRMAERPDHPWLQGRETPVILAAGRLARQKDHFTLIKAFARLATRRSCRLIILGEGALRKELEGFVADLKLTDRVSLPGWAENPFAFMSRASLFVLSSIYEGLGMVLIEALACGCPCVSTDCPAGPAEILEDGRVGPLVPVGDETALAEAMGRVLDQPPDRQVLKRRAACFSADRAIAAYENLLSTVVSAGHRSRRDAR